MAFPVFTPMNFLIESVRKSLNDCPQLFAKIIKEQTDYLTKQLGEKNESLKTELLRDVGAKGREISNFKQDCIETDSATRNYLSEIKIVLKEFETGLDIDSKNSKDIKDKIDFILKGHQTSEEKLALNEKLKPRQEIKFESLKRKKEVSTGTESKMFLSDLNRNQPLFSNQRIQSDILSINPTTAKSKLDFSRCLSPLSSNATLYQTCLEENSETKIDIGVSKATDLKECQQISPIIFKKEIETKSELDDEFQGSIRRRKSIKRFRTKSQSKLTKMKSVISTIDFSKKRKLVDVDDMPEILYESLSTKMNPPKIKQEMKIL